MAQSAARKHESTRRATYQDVLDAPAHRVAEIIDGTLYTHPRPAMPHARASSSLGVKIGGPFDYDAGGPGGWWIIDEPELHLGEEIVVPDLAGWRRERIVGHLTVAPHIGLLIVPPRLPGDFDQHRARPFQADRAQPSTSRSAVAAPCHRRRIHAGANLLGVVESLRGEDPGQERGRHKFATEPGEVHGPGGRVEVADGPAPARNRFQDTASEPPRRFGSVSASASAIAAITASPVKPRA